MMVIASGLITYFRRHSSAASRSSGRTLRNPNPKVSGILDSTSNLKFKIFILSYIYIYNIYYSNIVHN